MDFLQDWVAVQIKGWNWRSHYIVAKAHGQCNGLVLDILRYCSYIYIYLSGSAFRLRDPPSAPTRGYQDPVSRWFFSQVKNTRFNLHLR